jgi:hypothetical protein
VQQEVIMKRMFLITSIVIGAALAAGVSTAQTQPPPAAQPPAASKDAKAAPAAGMDHGKMGHGDHGKETRGKTMPGGMTGQGPGKGGKGMMMGGGMMGMGGDMCPMVIDAATKVQVKNLPKGVTITFTNDDAAVVAKLQKMAETIRLKQEAHTN